MRTNSYKTRVLFDGDNVCLPYPHAAVPVKREFTVGEVVGQAELGCDSLQVLSEGQSAQQVDLTMGKPRFHPLLQQLQDILVTSAKTSTDFTFPGNLNGANLME